MTGGVAGRIAAEGASAAVSGVYRRHPPTRPSAPGGGGRRQSPQHRLWSGGSGSGGGGVGLHNRGTGGCDAAVAATAGASFPAGGNKPTISRWFWE